MRPRRIRTWTLSLLVAVGRLGTPDHPPTNLRPPPP
jgi:hypothetical protein